MIEKKLIMTIGLPASGKSTWAKQQVDEFGFKRVNKDDLRAMIDNSRWSNTNEKAIIAIRDSIIVELLSRGHSVIVDDTNFHNSHEKTLRSIALENKADFEIKDFTHVSVEECIRRDKIRTNSVGESVIYRMYNDYLKNKTEKENV